MYPFGDFISFLHLAAISKQDWGGKTRKCSQELHQIPCYDYQEFHFKIAI